MISKYGTRGNKRPDRAGQGGDEGVNWGRGEKRRQRGRRREEEKKRREEVEVEEEKK
jgi:hypothetical protein